MAVQTPDLPAMLSRLERVEKENRRMKAVGLAVVMTTCSVFLMGQARPGSNKTVEAERFIVKDANGKVRATFGMEDGDLKGASLTIGSPGIHGGGREENYVVYLHGGDIAWLLLRAPGTTQALNARVGPVDPISPSPQLSLVDGEGYQTDIGHTGLVTERTGAKHNTSAASVVMFSSDKKVLWSAP